MQLLVHQLVNEFLPLKRKQSAKGWINFDAVCCHHRGHKKDVRGRGNLLMLEDGKIVINCYNCGFKTIYSGIDVSKKFESWLTWLGIPQSRIQEAKLEILQKKINGELKPLTDYHFSHIDDFVEVDLPENSIPMHQLINENYEADDFNRCKEYILSRGRAIYESYDYHWTPITKWDLNKRIIIPFRHHGKLIGWTARYAGSAPSGTPRYYNSKLPNDYIFNSDTIYANNRKFIIIVEGPFDAIAIDGIAVLGSTLNQKQINWLNSTTKEKIVLPDRQRKNQDLIDCAVAENWAVSFPEWEENIKDAADAQCRYGQIYTLATIIKARTYNKLQIDVKRRMFKD